MASSSKSTDRLGSHLAISILLVFLVQTIGGCVRSVQTIDHGRAAFAGGDLATASDTLVRYADGRSGLADAAALDLAMVQLAAGDVEAAEARLRTLRDKFDALPDFSVLGEAASVVTDDRVRIFRPAGYEQVMVRAMLSVCSLAGDGIDAESYALQATTKQNELSRQAKDAGVLGEDEALPQLALAPYIRGILREATHHDYDDAESAYRLVSIVRPQFLPAAEDIARASGGAHSRPGNGVLYVIACVGRGPVLQETTAPTTSTALSIASSVLNAETNAEETANGKRVGGPVLPNIASVKVPSVVIPPSDVAALGVRVGGQLLGATQTLTDVGELARRQNDSEMPWTIARAVVRRATKEATVAKVGDSLGLTGQVGSLFHFAAASAWAGSEHADTRCWGLLPREIQVLRAELPAGEHVIALQSLGFGGGPVGQPTTQTIRIVDGRNCYRIAIAPTGDVYVAR